MKRKSPLRPEVWAALITAFGVVLAAMITLAGNLVEK
jgi:hypothetical protein